MSEFNERIAGLSPEKRAELERRLLKKSSAPLRLQKIRRRETADPCVLSFSQERLWFLDQLKPGSPAYNIPLAVRLSGHLNVEALEQSIGEILRRHEVLRTTFVTDNGRPVQRGAPAAAFILSETDLSAMPPEQRETKVKQLMSEEASRPFDLEKGPLLRATLLLLNPGEHVLLVTMHHIVSDGWSMGILYRELSVLYEDFLKGKPSPLPELPIQYADFAVWQKEWLQGKNLEKQLAFWKEQLRDLSPLGLPTDYPRPSVQTFHGATHTFELPQDLTEAMRGLSRKGGVTLFMTLLTAFQALLHRYTGQDDIVVGTPIANRNREEIEGLIGFFVNTLVMRTDTSGDPVFRDLLKRVRKDTLDAYNHQVLPFEKLVEQLQPERDLSRNPLFQVMFAMQNMPVAIPEMSGLTLSLVGSEGTRTRFDLEVHLRETEEGLRVAFVYSTDLFDAATIERMARHYQRILQGIVDNSDLRLSELPLLTEAERQQILVEWNNTATDYPRDKCIHELFEEQVERTPDAIAVIFEDKHLTYRELNSRANQLAHYLRKQGVGPEVLVGICVERSLEMIIGVVGILKAGGTYVPLDPLYPKERLEFMIKDTKSPLILTQQRLVKVLPELTAAVVCLDSDEKRIAQENRENPGIAGSSSNHIYVMYTSGSTGRPKGVFVSHRAVNRLVMDTNYIELESSDRIAQASSFSFDAATFEIWGALLHGACLVGFKKEETLSPEDFADQIRTRGISVLFLTAALFNQMARQVPHAFRSVRYLLFGGEAVDPGCVRMVLEAGSPLRLLHVYGPTESTTFTSWFPVENVSADARNIPIGKPISNTMIYILDRTLHPVPVGVSGEMYIGGEGLAGGYLNRPELTSEKFIPNPFSKEPGARLYKTGDLARYLPDGNIEFLERIDDQVKIRGFRIELGEIEAVLGQHPDVREAVVTAREDPPGNKRLVAYVVLDRKSVIATRELRMFLKEKLPDYMVPSGFVVLDSLPCTPNGKVNRKALPKPDHIMHGQAKTFVAPRNTLESQVTKAWERVLGIQPIGITDNFFELGGHSLLAVRLASEISKMTRNKFPVMATFQFPTIEQLAAMVAKEGWSVQWPSSVPIQPSGSRPPFFWVHGQQSDSLLPRYLDVDQPLYGLLHQGQDGKVLYTTVEEIAAHYLEEIRTVQPVGPYLLGGYCFGAMVALEMAQNLLQQGDKVSVLFMLDPPKNCFPFRAFPDASLPAIGTFRSRVVHHSNKLARMQLGSKIAYAFRKLPRAFSLIRQGISKNSRENSKMAICRIYLFLRQPLPPALRSFYLIAIYRTAIGNYTPKLYPGRAIVCHSDKVSYGSGPELSRLTAGGVQDYEVPGAGHEDIVQEPYVGVWAPQLNMYLKEMQGKREDNQL